MHPFIADWYARERTEDFLREAQHERLLASARPARRHAPRLVPARWPRPVRWIQVHLGLATA